MTVYYLAARPENVASIISTGKYDTLHEYITSNQLYCHKNLLDCFIENLHQTFILVLLIPDKDDDKLILDKIDIRWIQRIILYSERSKKLLYRLLKADSSKNIPTEIKPERFSGNPLKRSQSFFDEQSQKSVVQTKAKRTDFFDALSDYTVRIPKEGEVEKYAPVYIDRLTTSAEHLYCLHTAFKKATLKLLITSFSMNDETFKNANLYEAIPSAIKRGVRIYIYYNDETTPDQAVLNFLKLHQVFCERTFTHTKILAIDNHTVVAGSFNWLSGIDRSGRVSEESSIAIQSQELCPSLIEDCWRYLKHYRAEQFGNIGAILSFEQEIRKSPPHAYYLGDETTLIYLATLEQQIDFFHQCFEEAAQRLIICSPFISSTQSYQADITLPLLRKTLRRGVDIYFICNSNTAEYDKLFRYVHQVHSSHIHLIGMKNIHLKTIIIDETSIAEGSFNWLSASRFRDAEHHNHEQVLVIQGKRACELVDDFYRSHIGETVLMQADNINDDIGQFDEDKELPESQCCLIL